MLEGNAEVDVAVDLFILQSFQVLTDHLAIPLKKGIGKEYVLCG